MKNSVRYFVGISLLFLALCYGCGENYQADMQAAQQAMDSAKAAFAEDLAPSDWKEAVKVWDQAQAAVKDGKPSITFFKRAKTRFEKTAKLAKSSGDAMAKEITGMQTTINERLAKVKDQLDRNRVSNKVANQVKPLVADLQESITTLENMVSQGNYLKAKMLARDLQTKVYNAELTMSGKKPK
jgi:hypothetical protein